MERYAARGNCGRRPEFIRSKYTRGHERKRKKTSESLGHLVCHPHEISNKVKGTAAKLKSTFEAVSEDITYITEKVEELRELTPQVTELLKETKDTFTVEDEEELLKEVTEENNSD